jgi:hypothetical protein
VGGICFPIFPERVRPVMEFHRGHIGAVGIGAARGMELVVLLRQSCVTAFRPPR